MGSNSKAFDPSRDIRTIVGTPFTAHVGPLPHNDIKKEFDFLGKEPISHFHLRSEL